MADVRSYLWKNDRNFNEEDFEQQQYFQVAEHNDLITKARHDLNARELKIMDYVISKIKPDDEHFNVIQTSMYELSNVLDLKRSGRTYSQLAQNLDDMRAKSIRIYSEKERRITMTGWFEVVDLWENGKVKLKINERFAPFLLKLKDKGHYTQYYLVDTVKLKSKYSIMLYKLMREADKDNGSKIAIVQGTPQEWKTWLGAPESYTYGRLKDKILNPAIEEINLEIEDMDLSLFQARRGRSVVQVEIHNNFIRNRLF
ncbi:hypothetical protein LPAF129_21040 [Ligilactobacillus pabuli]|uniref:Initiator Rep protein WH1 domain-containing protein n=1 Tax=Ligilactobacillus pabuli TaxID=2886039 RepID=A0ABQ5JKN0_9LACO|nr:replication initiation protein [Ligilactobacillus pabuli]GKS82418.1 hypothetical protein LPAF129_21040 [Ligilactobacillus pabuli]